MKKIVFIIIIVIIAVLMVGLAKDQIIKSIVTVAISKVTGARTEIKSFSLGIVKQSVQIKGFRIYQPQGFPKGILLDIPIVRVDYDIASLLKGKVYLKKVELNINEMGVVRNAEGALNVDSLTAVQKAKEVPPQERTKEQAPQKSKQGSAPAINLQIDELKLSVGKVVYSVYQKEGEPAVQAFDVGIKDKIYKDIRSPEQLVVLLLSEPMKATTIKGAKVYGAASVLGMGLLPVGVAATFMGKDSAAADFNKPFGTVYAMSIEALKKLGQVSKEDKGRGSIKAKVQGADIAVELTQKDASVVHVEVSARKLLLPKPEIAGGVMYELTERLK